MVKNVIKYGKQYTSDKKEYKGQIIYHSTRSAVAVVTKGNKIITAHGKYFVKNHWRKIRGR